MNEIFVAIKETNCIEAKIDALCDKYNNRYGADHIQQRALFRSYCHDTIKVSLMDKFNAEIGYFNIALLKAGIGISVELKGLAEIGRKHIEKYENELLKDKERFQGRYI